MTSPSVGRLVLNRDIDILGADAEPLLGDEVLDLDVGMRLGEGGRSGRPGGRRPDLRGVR